MQFVIRAFTRIKLSATMHVLTSAICMHMNLSKSFNLSVCIHMHRYLLKLLYSMNSYLQIQPFASVHTFLWSFNFVLKQFYSTSPCPPPQILSNTCCGLHLAPAPVPTLFVHPKAIFSAKFEGKRWTLSFQSTRIQ